MRLGPNFATVGRPSSLNRLGTPAHAAVVAGFDPNLELAPDPGFDNAGIGTIAGTGLTITGGQLVAVSTGSSANIVYNPTTTLTAGTYLFTLDTASTVNLGTVTVAVGGTTGTMTTSPTGVHTVSIVVATVTSQTIKIGNFFSGKTASFNSMSVKQTA